MRFNKSVMAFAVVAAFTVFGGHNAYAADTTQTQTGNDNQMQTDNNTNQTEVIAVTVASGDTLTAIAAAHQTTVDAIASQNGISDPNQIDVGQILQVVISKHQDKVSDHLDKFVTAAQAFINPPAPAPVVVAATTSSTANVVATKTTATAATSHTELVESSAGNTYVWGTCTWYVKSRVPGLPNHLGNGGYGWLTAAAAAGMSTGSAPVAGAVGVESGHVVYVESVSGSNVTISEMNYAGGVGVVHYRTVPADTFMYIYV